MTSTKPLPDRVRQHLVDVGLMTTDGLGRRAQLRACSACSAWVLVGLDANLCAIRVVVDLVELDVLGEAMALLDDRPTFELWGKELERRDRWKITGGQRKPVVATHQCGIKSEPSGAILALFIRPETKRESEAPF